MTNPTQWEAGSVPEPAAWALSTKLFVSLGGLNVLFLSAIGILVLAGFNAQNTKIETGDKALLDTVKSGHDSLCVTLKELKDQNFEFNKVQIELIKDVATLKANQKARLDRENIEHEFMLKNGKK